MQAKGFLMGSTRRSRSVNKRFAKVNEEWPDKGGANANKNRPRKRKLSDMLGPQWSEEELERFYEAYRKYDKDWKKVAGMMQNRSLEMVEALYNVAKAYLSLKEGVATAAGLIAMISDHYKLMEGIDSERESNDVPRTSRRPQKRARGKYRLMSKGSDGPYPDLLQFQSASSSYGSNALLKKKRTGDLFPGNRPRAVGRRTPRIPVSNMYSKDDRDNIGSFGKNVVTSAVDEGAHVAALALAEVSQKGGPPQVSWTPGRRGDHLSRSPARSGERRDTESEMADSKTIGGFDVDYPEGSLGSREAENGDFTKDVGYLMDTRCASTYGTHQKQKKLRGNRSKAAQNENDHFDDDREACSGTEEGLNVWKIKDGSDMEVTDDKTTHTSKGSRRRSCQLFSGDESTAFDALQTLADLSFHILLPSSAVESDSSIQPQCEKGNVHNYVKPSVPESLSTNYVGDMSKSAERKDRSHVSVAEVDTVTRKIAKSAKGVANDANVSTGINQLTCPYNNKMQRKGRKLLTKKTSKTKFESTSQKSEPQKMEASVEEGRRSIDKVRRFNHGPQLLKQGKLSKPSEHLSAGIDLSRCGTNMNETNKQGATTSKVSLPTKVRSRRKLGLQKALAMKECKPNESIGDECSYSYSLQANERMFDSKEKVFHCLSSRLLRRWCVFEWFYSAIDYPWFAKTEFVEYLNHVKLELVPRLTRVEWGVIRSSLGKPRRLSNKFLQEEREKLEQYRESVRTHYAELRAGVKEGLPADLARPLSVGQRVSACHPKTREIHDGSVLTVDRSRCRIQFDQPELGVEFVMDLDCMPVNPLENMPEALRRQNVGIYKFCNSFTDIKLDGLPKEWKYSMKSAPRESSDIADGSSYIYSPSYPMNTLMKEAKGDTIDAIVQAKAVVNEVVVAAQQAMYSQPCTLAQIRAREADIRALAELARALDKKEALLIELRHMNEEVSGNQKDSSPITDLENFRKQYAMVLLQLKDANNQVASSLFCMRERNTYVGNSTPPWHKPIDSSAGAVSHHGSFNPVLLTQDSGSHVLEIVQSSRQKARTMVDIAVQATRGLREGEDAFIRIGEALDLNARNSNARYIPPDPAHGNYTNQDRATSCKLEATTSHILSSKPNTSKDGNVVQFPADIISNCVATLFMIQNCADGQYPPAEVAQVLDSAVTSLQPSCPQNLPVYREIETCMGIIKHQMLPMIPTPSAYSADASVV